MSLISANSDIEFYIKDGIPTTGLAEQIKNKYKKKAKL